MYKLLTIKDRLRVAPDKLGPKVKQAIEESVRHKYEGMIFSDTFVIAMNELKDIGEGIIIPGDGSVFYDATFDVLAYEPKINELVEGRVSEVTEFGAFIEIGPIDGLSHLSQVMDDFVSYSKSGTLAGKKSKRTLSVNDRVIARVIAVSLKAVKGAKIGLTMRQGGLGKLDWLEKEKVKKSKEEKKEKKGKDSKDKTKGGKKWRKLVKFVKN